MEDYPKTLLELEKRFSTEEACRKYLCQLRWPTGFICPVCDSKKGWQLKTGFYECPQCRHKTSVISGTIFEGTHKPLVLWFRVMWNVISQKNGVSAMSIDRALGIGSYKTAWIWLHKIRRAMVRPGRDRLHGIVQVDETFIGGKSHGKRGRGAAGKSLVLVAVEKDGNGSGRIRLKQIPDASGQSLNEALQLTVEPGSIVETDDWKGYSQIGKKGYKRQIIRTTCDLGDNLLPLCHRQAALLKRWLDGTHHGAVSHEHLCYYLDEYTFRFNRRTSSHRGKLFYRLLQNAISINPTHLDDIAKGIRGKTHGKTHNI